jgi:hypothetical protein
VTDSHTPGLPATSARNEHGIRAALLERYPDMGVNNQDWETPPRTVYGRPRGASDGRLLRGEALGRAGSRRLGAERCGTGQAIDRLDSFGTE